MKKQNIRGAAPMPRREEDIRNSMKLYTYLVCISGLATYPDNTRMFRQKNMILSKIKNATGITDKTVKLYLYELEHQGLISYQGQIKRITPEEHEEILEKIKNASEGSKERKYNEAAGALIWKKRNKMEKDGVYYIPRPNKWTPIPEITLQKLNDDFDCSELELKLYFLCCSYRDLCCYENKNTKILTFESVKDAFNIKKNSSDINKTIRKALLFLKSIGLIEYTEQLINNSRGAAIPCFKLHEVNYYINYEIEEVNMEIEDEDLKEILLRVNEIMSNIE